MRHRDKLFAALVIAAAAVFICVPQVWAEEGAAAASGKGPLLPKGRSLDDFMMLSQPYITNISAYEPIYFLFGTSLSKSKFQFSFKYHFLDAPDEEHRWMNGINFGYTQTSFWDLEEESLPFKDTSYKPELFYVTDNLKSRGLVGADGFFLKGGIRHESNGRGGAASRSTNYLYLEPIVIFYNPESRYGMRISPEVWAYVKNSASGNPDLRYYRGFFKLKLKMGKADGPVFGADLGWAREGGSCELNFTYPLRTGYTKNLRIYLHVQYVNVLAESLLDYRDRTDATRIGFSFVR